MLVCSSLSQNVVLIWLFHTRTDMKITGSQVQADDGGWSNNIHQKRFRSLSVAAAVYGWALSWRRTIPEDNIPRHLFWIKEWNYNTHSTFGGRLYCFRHVYRLTTWSELTSAMCRDWRVYRIYANIPRIFFLEFSEEKLGCAHYLKQGWYCSASKQMIPSYVKEWSANHVLSRLLLQDLVIACSWQKKSLG